MRVMVGRSPYAVLAFALAVVAAIATPTARAGRGDDGGTTDAIGIPRGAIQHAKRVERVGVTPDAPRAVHAAPPPPGFELAAPDRACVVVGTARALAGAPTPAVRAVHARGPPA